MAQAPASRLLIQLPMHADESVVSLVQRHCEANYVERMLDMLRLIARVAGEAVEDVRDIAHSCKALQAVETLTGLAAGALDGHFVAPLQTTHLRVGHHEWASGQRRAEVQAYCPTCFQEYGYARSSWEFVQAPVCLVHGVELLEKCPSCARPLRHRRTRLLRCGECGFALASAPTTPISPGARAVAAVVQHPVIVAMGGLATTAPVDQADLSTLLRLCLPPEENRGGRYGLTESLARFSIAERVGALDRLGAAWVDRRIDTERLRAVVLQRWPWAGLLPAKARVNLLNLAAMSAELPSEVLRLLCFDSYEEREPPAAIRFGGRPPQLMSVDAVAAYLGIDKGALAALRGSEGLAPPPEDLGHDMDQVLALQRDLDALLTANQVDDILGVEGLTLELLNLKLLNALRLADGTVLGVSLESLELLMSLTQEKVDGKSPVPENAVPLAMALAQGSELSGLAWMVAQIRGGSLRAYRWPAPHRVVDLVVDGDRLRELTHWPSEGHHRAASAQE